MGQVEASRVEGEKGNRWKEGVLIRQTAALPHVGKHQRVKKMGVSLAGRGTDKEFH